MRDDAPAALQRWADWTLEHERLAGLGYTPEGMAAWRRRTTRDDPALFALVYLRRHLKDAAGMVGLADVHVRWAKSAQRWMRRDLAPMRDRRAEIAPREMGKSTWWFLLLPMWAAAHEHVGFAAAFADTEQQAQTHLASFKAELDANALIRTDFPDLVAPKTRGRGTLAADRVSLYHARSGFIFAAAGMDSSNLGMKVGDRRPDLLVLDDIEPHEGRYSVDLARKRRATLLEVIFPLNLRAHVAMVGTVTMVGSIIHQVVRHARGEHDAEDDRDGNAWVGAQRIKARHTLPLITNDDGERVSIWPAKWPTKLLLEMEGTREYAKNYANDPLGADGDYWTLGDIEQARALGKTEPVTVRTRILVSVDPAVTSKKSSDYTGLGVVAWEPPSPGKALGRCAVLEVRQVKADPERIRLRVIELIEKHDAGLVLVEVNQGGDLWTSMLWGLPVKVKTVHQSEGKELRAADALRHYQRGRVTHQGAHLVDYEGQLTAFPRAPHDDMVDAVGSAIRYFLSRKRSGVKVGGKVAGYRD